ncbi:MAG: DUF2235 domain-containing protein [Pyrinomonadaceae bacterium]|nr:DUF2235 domain-containing protein [Pyrinomonadaceae bacterium]
MALYAFDGTWNKPDTKSDNIDQNTNVFNFLPFYAPGDAEARDKIEEYEAGVGTRFGAPGRIVGGFFGAGGRDRVHEMVDSFATNWKRNGPEDRTVDVIGFSRGAALALHFCNALTAGVKIDGETVKPAIRFLGLWDVVPSFGLPGIIVPDAHAINLGWKLDVPSCVERCYHAMALDERRGAFDVYRLDPENDDAPRMQEWWFRGVHSDVGGGNGNVERCNIALVWMLQQAHARGLPIDLERIATLRTDFSAPVAHTDFQGRWQDRTILKGDRLHPSAGQTLRRGESKSVNVDCALWFDFSGLLVEEGAQYCFTPDAKGSWIDKNIECDASGWPEEVNRGQKIFGWLKEKVLESRIVGLSKRVPDGNWFEMIACVSTTARPAVAVGHGQFAHTPWRCPASGPLFFFANDARLGVLGHDFYGNNKGAIDVLVERVA